MLQNIPEHTVWGAPQRESQDKQGRVLESAGCPTRGYWLDDLDPSPSAEQLFPKPSKLRSSECFLKMLSESPWTLGHNTQDHLFAWNHDTC